MKDENARGLIIEQHYESRITVLDHPEYGKIVRKRYLQNHPCIQWLNGILLSHYPDPRIMPVAQHEARALALLSAHRVAPRPIGCEANAVIMEFAGAPITSCPSLDAEDFYRQAVEITKLLITLNFRHNDLLPRNVLVHDGRVKLIDFTLAEFGNVSLMNAIPDRSWARPGEDYNLLNYGSLFLASKGNRSMPDPLKEVAESTYNYHNLGVGIFPAGEEKTPYGSGERYNFDRMSMMVANYDFTKKHVVDLGCNSGWFCFQAKLLGSDYTLGIDYSEQGMMGKAIRYAEEFEKRFQLGVKFLNHNLEEVDLVSVARAAGIEQFNCALLLSVMHHIAQKKRLFESLYVATSDIIFYEDHEFWNELYDESGHPIVTKGEGYRYGWNEDMSWQRKIGSIEKYEPMILRSYAQTWRSDVLMMDKFREIRFLGFSEKRRPLLAFIK